jgi:hypothetical protein
VAAGHAERSAHLQRHILRVVHELHVERVRAYVDDRVTVQVLRLAVVRLADVYGVVVDQRLRPDQAVDGAGHLRQLDEPLDELGVHERLRQRGAVRDAGDAGRQDVDRLLVHVVRYDGVHPERPSGHEARHLNRREEVLTMRVRHEGCLSR